MRTFIALLLIAWTASIARAEDGVSQAQQALKDQGFYFGQVTGKKDTDTSDAVRRFQIRNGLQVNGELNDETLKVLNHPPAAAQVKPPPSPQAPPATVMPVPNTSPVQDTTADLRADPAQAPVVRGNALPPQPFTTNPPNHTVVVPPPVVERTGPEKAGLFAGTPYETAPAEVQRRVVSDAQITLGRRGFYRGAVDGYDSEELEFSLRAYQSGLHLPLSGRLDLATLGNLNLLPGGRQPYAAPRRRLPPPGLPEAPVRGEWIRP